MGNYWDVIVFVMYFPAEKVQCSGKFKLTVSGVEKDFSSAIIVLNWHEKKTACSFRCHINCKIYISMFEKLRKKYAFWYLKPLRYLQYMEMCYIYHHKYLAKEKCSKTIVYAIISYRCLLSLWALEELMVDYSLFYIYITSW